MAPEVSSTRDVSSYYCCVESSPHETEKVINATSTCLDKLMNIFARNQSKKDSISIASDSDESEEDYVNTFILKDIPNIPFASYLERLRKWTEFEPSIFIVALMLLDKAFKANWQLRDIHCLHK